MYVHLVSVLAARAFFRVCTHIDASYADISVYIHSYIYFSLVLFRVYTYRGRVQINRTPFKMPNKYILIWDMRASDLTSTRCELVKSRISFQRNVFPYSPAKTIFCSCDNGGE